MAGRTYGPGEVAILGEAIYREHIQRSMKTTQKGTFVVIDVETGDYEVDSSDVTATKMLLDRRPDAVTYAIRVGHRATYSHVAGIRTPRGNG